MVDNKGEKELKLYTIGKSDQNCFKECVKFHRVYSCGYWIFLVPRKFCET